MAAWRAGVSRLKRGAKRRVDRMMVSPAPSRDRVGRGRPVVAGLLTSSSGLGRAARMTYAALDALGLRPTAFDLTPLFPAHTSNVAFDAPPPADDAGPLIVQINPPETPAALRAIGPKLLSRRHRVGYWVYELPRAPGHWRQARALVNEVWAPSRYAADAVATAACEPPRVVLHPVAALPAPCGAEDAHAMRERLVGNTGFVAGCAADARSSLARKNPEAAIEAFMRAFPDDPDARSIVHVTNGDVAPNAFARLKRLAEGDSRIVLSTQPLGDDGVAALLSACDVWVSLHRAEGFGLTIAEALLAGRPVVATSGSGAADFAHLAGVHPVDARDVKVIDPEGPYLGIDRQWRDPDVDLAAAALRRAREASPDADVIRAEAERFFSAGAFGSALSKDFLALATADD